MCKCSPPPPSTMKGSSFIRKVGTDCNQPTVIIPPTLGSYLWKDRPSFQFHSANHLIKRSRLCFNFSAALDPGLSIMPVQQHVLNWLYSVLTSVRCLLPLSSFTDTCRNHVLTSAPTGISRRQPRL